MHELKKEPLGKFSIYISKNYSFGTDAVLLSNFAGSKKSKMACDLGTGCGIIPLLLLKDLTVNSVYGIEIQSDAAKIAEENAKLNNIDNNFKVLNIDLKDVKSYLPHAEFDLVTCNPPYKINGAGSQNLTEAQKIARHEVKCVFADIVNAAKHLLKYGGRLCICHRPERLADVFCDMRNAGIEPKLLRLVVQKYGNEPWLVLVEGRLGGNKGLTIMPPLYVEENGELSDEMMQIYGDYKDGKDRRI